MHVNARSGRRRRRVTDDDAPCRATRRRPRSPGDGTSRRRPRADRYHGRGDHGTSVTTRARRAFDRRRGPGAPADGRHHGGTDHGARPRRSPPPPTTDAGRSDRRRRRPPRPCPATATTVPARSTTSPPRRRRPHPDRVQPAERRRLAALHARAGRRHRRGVQQRRRRRDRRTARGSVTSSACAAAPTARTCWNALARSASTAAATCPPQAGGAERPGPDGDRARRQGHLGARRVERAELQRRGVDHRRLLRERGRASWPKILKFGAVPVRMEPQAAETVSADARQGLAERGDLLAAWSASPSSSCFMVFYYRTFALIILGGLDAVGRPSSGASSRFLLQDQGLALTPVGRHRHHRVDRHHRRLVRRAVRARQGRAAPRPHACASATARLRRRVAHDPRRPTSCRCSAPLVLWVVDRRLRCAASPSSSASPRACDLVILWFFTRPSGVLLLGRPKKHGHRPVRRRRRPGHRPLRRPGLMTRHRRPRRRPRRSAACWHRLYHGETPATTWGAGGWRGFAAVAPADRRVALLRSEVRQLNLGIDFEGGVAWRRCRPRRARHRRRQGGARGQRHRSRTTPRPRPTATRAARKTSASGRGADRRGAAEGRRRALATKAGVQRRRGERRPRSARPGARSITEKAVQALVVFLAPRRWCPSRGALEWRMALSAIAGYGPRRRDQRRRLLGVRVRGDPGHRRRLPHGPRLLALRHRSSCSTRSHEVEERVSKAAGLPCARPRERVDQQRVDALLNTTSRPCSPCMSLLLLGGRASSARPRCASSPWPCSSACVTAPTRRSSSPPRCTAS